MFFRLLASAFFDLHNKPQYIDRHSAPEAFCHLFVGTERHNILFSAEWAGIYHKIFAPLMGREKALDQLHYFTFPFHSLGQSF